MRTQAEFIQLLRELADDLETGKRSQHVASLILKGAIMALECDPRIEEARARRQALAANGSWTRQKKQRLGPD